MSKSKENPQSKEFLEGSLGRLRKRLTYVQDEMDITSFAIKAIEHDLKQIQEEDKKANETNA